MARHAAIAHADRGVSATVVDCSLTGQAELANFIGDSWALPQVREWMRERESEKEYPSHCFFSHKQVVYLQADFVCVHICMGECVCVQSMWGDCRPPRAFIVCLSGEGSVRKIYTLAWRVSDQSECRLKCLDCKMLLWMWWGWWWGFLFLYY